MANIYVGFHDNRSSSRVLKPPGGGTSNIFGTDKMPDVVPQKAVPQQTNGDSTKQTAEETVIQQKAQQPEVVVDAKQNGVTPNGETPNDNYNGGISQKQNGDVSSVKFEKLTIEENGNIEPSEVINTPTKQPQIEANGAPKSPSSIGDIIRQDDADISEKRRMTPNRNQNRIPPGGFSSGLW